MESQCALPRTLKIGSAREMLPNICCSNVESETGRHAESQLEWAIRISWNALSVHLRWAWTHEWGEKVKRTFHRCHHRKSHYEPLRGYKCDILLLKCVSAIDQPLLAQVSNEIWCWKTWNPFEFHWIRIQPHWLYIPKVSEVCTLLCESSVETVHLGASPVYHFVCDMILLSVSINYSIHKRNLITFLRDS